ncbi:MAG: amidohydrolase family protein [Saprospiraceae bacterium]|nr:amidohydrolase family protein [Saprospiraceae bacterium]
MRFISADYIFPITGEIIPNGVVVMNGQKVEKVTTRAELGTADIEKFNGIILPGFVNTHCHLELSHMKGLTQTGTKLIPFISNVVKLRDFDEAIIQLAIKKWDKAMFESGIQAVGDISNKTDTAAQKELSPIKYYTFVEMFDFMQATLIEPTVVNYRTVFAGQAKSGGNKKSFVPHAPYSVSKDLFEFINKANPESSTISIHNQETLDENRLFEDGSGDFKSFYKGFGFEMDDFTPIGKGSIYYALKYMEPKARNIFVHNTLSTESDIAAAHQWSENLYWATCPNANLYIENRLPYYRNFLNQNAKMTIGTDSIMSNWQLSIWEEIKTIKKHQSYVPLQDLLKWATINGAEALGYETEIGSIEEGKTPGLVHLALDWQGDDTILEGSQARRIL